MNDLDKMAKCQCTIAEAYKCKYGPRPIDSVQYCKMPVDGEEPMVVLKNVIPLFRIPE